MPAIKKKGPIIRKYVTSANGGLAQLAMVRSLCLTRSGSIPATSKSPLDSRYQQESVGGHHIPKYVCSAQGFNITINTPIFFVSKKKICYILSHITEVDKL